MDLSKLNEPQRQAVLHTDGPLLVLAGAGSGKTRVLTHRIAYLIENGVQPWSILAITFTNKAAKEMQERVTALAGESANGCWVSTFHSMCAKMLRRDIEKLAGYTRSFTIYDSDDQQRLIREVLKELQLDEKMYQPRAMSSVISDAKNHLLSPQEWLARQDGGFREQKIADIYKLYEDKLKKSNSLDFDDLLIKTLELFAQQPPVLDSYRRRFDYIMVDEYQDTNSAQYQLVRLLTGYKQNLCVVGDDDQSIYGWRGADINNILDFEKDFPNAVVIKLEQNYRSTGNILDAANQVIAHNIGRKEKALWTSEAEGEKIHLYEASDEREESYWIANMIEKLLKAGDRPGDMAILYRVNSLSRVIEETLVRSGLKYRVFGGLRFYDRKEVKDLTSYLRVIVNANDDIALRRIINEPKRSIGDATIDKLAQYAADNDLPLFSALVDAEEAGLSARALKSVQSFVEMMEELIMALNTMPLDEFVNRLIEVTRYKAQYEQEKSDENTARLQNIDEFYGSIVEFVKQNPDGTLADYLENVALVTDQDRSDEDAGSITLMTIHSAKGLEFKNVFVMGMEEYIFPTTRAQEDDKQLEEERRLCYVAITRARQRLYLTHARSRTLYGRSSMATSSRFLDELPMRVVESVNYGTRSGNLMRPSATHGGNSTTPRSSDDGWTRVSAGRSISPDQIPGVTRGMPKRVESTAAAVEKYVIFNVGDRIYHKKFGNGKVTQTDGTGAAAKVSVVFDDGREATFKVASAPMIKVG